MKSYCFLWSLNSALHPKSNVSSTGSYPHTNGSECKYNDIKFPINLKDIPKFERMNGLSIKSMVQSLMYIVRIRKLLLFLKPPKILKTYYSSSQEKRIDSINFF